MNKHYWPNLLRVLLKIVLLLLGVMVFGGCSPAEDEPDKTAGETVEKPQYQATILAVGDSLTAGYGVVEQMSYPALLQAKLLSDNRKYRVINGGVSGETSSGTVSRLNWLLSMKPDIVILVIGANDGLRGLDLELLQNNLDLILTELKANNIVIVFAGMKMVWNLGPDYTKRFSEIYVDAARRHEVIFFPFFLEGVATLPELNLADGIHPNAQGYQVIVDNLYPHVIEAINVLNEHASME